MERRIGAGGLRLGDGGDPDSDTTVVFVHGAMDRGAAFLRVARRLRKCRWLLYDRRGYGRSCSAGVTDVAGHSRDLTALLDELRAGRAGCTGGSSPPGSIVLVGHSLGGTLALNVAGTRPDLVDAVMVYESPLSWLPWWPQRSDDEVAADRSDPRGAAERFMIRMVGEERWRSLPESTRESRRSEGAALVAEMDSLPTRAWVEPARIGCPVLVARGGEAGAVRVRAAEWLATELVRVDRDEVPGVISGVISGVVSGVVPGADHDAHLTHVVPFAGLVTQTVDLVALHH